MSDPEYGNDIDHWVREALNAGQASRPLYDLRNTYYRDMTPHERRKALAELAEKNGLMIAFDSDPGISSTYNTVATLTRT